MRRGSLVCAWPCDATQGNSSMLCSLVFSTIAQCSCLWAISTHSTLEHLKDHVSISSAYLLQDQCLPCADFFFPAISQSKSQVASKVSQFTCVNKVRAYPPKSVWKTFTMLIQILASLWSPPGSCISSRCRCSQWCQRNCGSSVIPLQEGCSSFVQVC